MWVFFSNAFLSIVAPTPDSDAARNDMLVIRARIKGDIENVFPGHRVFEDKKYVRDYRFRAVVPRSTVMAAMVKTVNDLNYTNFKDSTGDHKHWRHTLYMRVWSVMFNAQEDRRPKRKFVSKGKGEGKVVGNSQPQHPYDIGAPYGSDEFTDDFDPSFNSLTGMFKN